MTGDSERTKRTLSLTTGGITLLGVLLSTGITVGLGVSGPWWVRLLAGVGTLVALVTAVKLTTRAGQGPLSRLARWVIGSEEEPAPPEQGDRRRDDSGA